MNLNLFHRTHYQYAESASLVVQALRMWPTSTSAQRVSAWQVSVDGANLHAGIRDGFGNGVATFTVDRSVRSIEIIVRGSVQTTDHQGVHQVDNETLPPAFYLGRTPLTEPDADIVQLAEAGNEKRNVLERVHHLSQAVRDRVDYRPQHTHSETTAIEALKLGAGVCQDHAHVLISALRSVAIPARYVSGYLCPIDANDEAASHAWAEAYIPDLGWVGFDAANRQSPDERYIRIAHGRDYRDAAPVRGVRIGGLAETLEVDVRIVDAAQGVQQQ